jgi:membrane-bound lytic murein transglycosylase B
MSAKRFGRLHRATALVPLALLSAAWTASLAGVNAPLAAAGEVPDPTLPDGTSVPTQAIEAPASVSDGSALGPGVGDADAAQIVSSASTSGIPSAALGAYQRAETVINAADKSCNLTWQLIAAIGRVESNHGRANGNVLDDSGLATPGIYGIALNGANQTTEIVDTDAGQYDNDTSYDRAVGPMQFIPSTWSVVGVDADGDGVRNPQDVDDAALGTAVYLCSGADDLGTDQGRQAAVYRYNHSQSYVDLVLAIMDAYLEGDFTSIPNGTVMAGEITATPPDLHVPGTPTGKPDTQVKPPAANNNDDEPVEPEPTQTPTDDAGTGNGGGNGGGDGGGGNGNGGGVHLPNSPVTIPPLPSTSIPPVDQVLTLAQATVQCTLDGLNQVLQPDKFQQCLDAYMNPRTAAEKQATGDARARFAKQGLF